MPNGRILGKIPSPLEVVDAGLDTVAEVVQLPARAGSNLFMSGQKATDRIKSAIDKPKEYSQAPAPPDVVAGAASGVVEGIGGIFDALQKTGEGVRKQIDGLIKR
ncbi:MAG: hypothetical protein Q7K03_07270 [Dehalococcoidia bacterium]|nr:hypothetical protein [Dehalococcoidia bacterium]